MVLSDIAIRRPVSAIVLSLLIVIFGIFSFRELAVREMPDIDPPIVSISTIYQGASAQVVESQITQLVEDTVSGIEGIKVIRSSSQEGRSNVRIEFNLSRPIETAANDVRDRIARIVDDLPDGVTAPVVSKVDSDASPIIYLSLSNPNLNALELTDLANRSIVDRLSVINGVANASVAGAREYSMRIWLDRLAMAARGITVSDISSALRSQNVELPAGRLESAQREFTIRADTRLKDVQQFRNLIVAQSDNYLVRLGEVAKVEVGPRDDRGEFRLNGKAVIGITVSKQAKANTLEVGAGVRNALPDILASLPKGTDIDITYDESVFISKSINEVYHAIFIAMFLVLCVVFIFLRNARATLIPMLAIPVSIIGSMIALAAFGFSINVLTLLAMVLAIGLVVDDAIIVLENISRRIEEGEPPLVAAFRGARQIGFAVLATTAVLVAVFLPISFLTGNVGRLFSEFGIAMASAVLFSMLVALTLTPMLCSKILRPTREDSWLVRKTEHLFSNLNNGYRRILEYALTIRPLIIFGAAGLFAGCFILFNALPRELEPLEDRGTIFINVTGPEGASIGYTRGEMEKIDVILKPYLDGGEVGKVTSILAPGFGGPSSVNRAIYILRLAPWEMRKRSQNIITQEITSKLTNVPGVRAIASNPSGLGIRGLSTPVQVVLRGNTYEELAAWRDRLFSTLRDDPSVRNLRADYDETKPELHVSIDRNRAADLGLSISDVGQTLETMLGGRVVTRYEDHGDEYDVVLQARSEDRVSASDLSNIFIRSSNSKTLIPLSSVVHLTEAAGPSQLNRFDRLRSITISASLGTGATLGDVLSKIRDVAAEVLPPQALLAYDGASREFFESGTALYVTFGLALLIVFLVLAAQFESFIHPFTILLTVPLALFGALGSLWITGLTINIYTQIGMIMLIGLVAKNAILIVEFANQLRDEGKPLHDAVVEAAVARLRPILMTSIATVCGALPLALATGAGAKSREAIGVVIAGGVSFSTLLSLILVPVIYSLISQRTRTSNYISDTLKAYDRHQSGTQIITSHAAE
ncbi:MAG: efflux RND transporter permease subunit [Alphaproteobacteria bacterium]